MSRQFTAHSALLTKVIAFTGEHGPLTHERLGSPEVLAAFTNREITELRQLAPMLRDPESRPRRESRFGYNAMAIRDVLIALDELGYSASEQELTKVRSDFRRAAAMLLDELAVAGARTTKQIRGRETAPAAVTDS